MDSEYHLLLSVTITISDHPSYLNLSLSLSLSLMYTHIHTRSKFFCCYQLISNVHFELNQDKRRGEEKGQRFSSWPPHVRPRLKGLGLGSHCPLVPLSVSCSQFKEALHTSAAPDIPLLLVWSINKCASRSLM